MSKKPLTLDEFIAKEIEGDTLQFDMSQNEFNNSKGLLFKGRLSAYERIKNQRKILDEYEKENTSPVV